MSGEATIIVWDDAHVAFFGTGMMVSYMSEGDASRGFSHDETALLTEWWSRRAALDAVFRADPNVASVTREIAEKLDVHGWRHANRPPRIGDLTMAVVKPTKDFRTRIAWVPCRAPMSAELTERARSIVSASFEAERPCSSTWHAGESMVNRETVATESAEHAALLHAYTDDCCAAAAKHLEALSKDWFAPMDEERTERVDLGDPMLRMSVSFTPRIADAGARIQAALVPAVMPDALARIESRRPRQPQPIIREHPTFRLHVETSLWMSSEHAREWSIAATDRALAIAPACALELANARKKSNVPHDSSALMDGLELESTDWFRATMYYRSSASQKARMRLYECLRSLRS